MSATATGSVVLALAPTPARSLLREWLAREGFAVREASAWEVDRLDAAGRADVVVTTDDLDGEWDWSGRLDAAVLVIAPPRAR